MFEKIKMGDMLPILEGIYNNPSLRKSIVPLFIGNPGIGKSTFVNQLAKKKGVKVVELITSQMSPFEISGICVPSHTEQKMVYYDFDRLNNLQDGDILFFDELLNGNPTVLNACLTVLEQRTMISGKELPNIMIVAAANPQGMVPLTPQIKERFIWYEFEFDKNAWIPYIMDKYRMPKNIAMKLSQLVESENFKGLNNFNSARSIDKNVDMMIHNVPTPYYNILNPILSTFIKNSLDKPIELGGDRVLEPNETISWLELIRFSKSIVVPEESVEEVDVDTFVLPDKWALKVTESNISLLQDNKELVRTDADFELNDIICCEDYHSNFKHYSDKMSIKTLQKRGYTEITTEQFKKYFLNK